MNTSKGVFLFFGIMLCAPISRDYGTEHTVRFLRDDDNGSSFDPCVGRIRSIENKLDCVEIVFDEHFLRCYWYWLRYEEQEHRARRTS